MCFFSLSLSIKCSFFHCLPSIRLDHFISTIQLPELIELDTYARLQVHILHNEIRARLNDGNISSSRVFFYLSKLFYFHNSKKDYCHLVVHLKVHCILAVYLNHFNRRSCKQIRIFTFFSVIYPGSINNFILMKVFKDVFMNYRLMNDVLYLTILNIIQF